MYLLTEWEGRAGKYLAQGQDTHQNCFAVFCEGVRISSRAVRVFPALSPRRVQPSYMGRYGSYDKLEPQI